MLEPTTFILYKTNLDKFGRYTRNSPLLMFIGRSDVILSPTPQRKTAFKKHLRQNKRGMRPTPCRAYKGNESRNSGRKEKTKTRAKHVKIFTA